MIFVTVAVNVTAGGSSFALELPDAAQSEEIKVKSSDFPSEFVFGVTTSAAQVIN